MKPRTRSVSGAVLMLALIPGIVGLLACLPVPIGDPERSRIDPDITGVWAAIDGQEVMFYAFEAYDKRTWLLTGVLLEETPSADFSAYDLTTRNGVSQLLENEIVGPGGATSTGVVLYKAWRTKLGGEWFMTWEGLFPHSEEKFVPEYWIVSRIHQTDENTLDLYLVNGEDELFKTARKTRRAYEKILKKNALNPDLFSEDPLRFRRVLPEHRGFVEDLAAEVVATHE